MNKNFKVVFILLTLVLSLSARATEVETLLGTGSAGFANGDISVARFSSPRGLAIDNDGNIYVADVANHRIRKIDTNGVVSTFAGTGSAGFTDGDASEARFNQPHDIAIDSSGNLYVADSRNRRIRKITPQGLVSTLSGTGSAGFTDGAGAVARFNQPEGIAVNNLGEVFVADTNNRRIRKILADGTTSTLAGEGSAGFIDGPAATARFNSPRDVAVDPVSGDLIVADTVNDAIRRVNSNGDVSTIAGNNTVGFVDGPGFSALMSAPEAVTVDSTGNIYFADSGNNRIRFIDTANVVSTIAGKGVAGFLDGDDAFEVLFSSPQALAVNNNGELFVSDLANHRIRKISTIDSPGSIEPPINNAPLIQLIDIPAENILNLGESFNLRAVVLDVEDGDISNNIQWRSDIDGFLANGATLDTAILSEGLHNLTATVSDSGGLTGELEHAIAIIEEPPAIVEILRPTANLVRRRRVRLQGLAFRIVDGEVVDISDQINWISDVQGFLGRGSRIRVRLDLGAHNISASVDGSSTANSSNTAIAEHPIRVRRRR